MARKINTLALLTVCITLTACTASNVRENLGLNSGTPDEFSVVKRAPLELPPAFETGVYVLPTPTPGKARPQEFSAEIQAQKILETKEEKLKPTQTLSKGEKSFLANIGAEKTPSNIREVLDEENKNWLDENVPVVEKLGLKEGSATKKQILEPKEEAERLKTLEDVLNVVSPPLNDTNL